MNREQLLAEMEKLAEAGDEKAFDRFVLDHFTEFPEEVQGKLLMNFYTENLEKRAGEAAIADIQKQGLQALEDLQKIKESVQKGE
ncbi:MAG TPA: hypothetical protein VG102_03935 [Candidatus Paceibacterota bacterium]|nr:hypothetical protein [Candidatus Paceibacterota bacterium]